MLRCMALLGYIFSVGLLLGLLNAFTQVIFRNHHKKGMSWPWGVHIQSLSNRDEAGCDLNLMLSYYSCWLFFDSIRFMVILCSHDIFCFHKFPILHFRPPCVQFDLLFDCGALFPTVHFSTPVCYRGVHWSASLSRLCSSWKYITLM